MALPSIIKTWQYSVSQLVAATGSPSTEAQALFLAIKNAMIAFGSTAWTVRYSCNKTTAGTAGDGVDRWTTTASIVDTNSGTHSWMVLRQTGLGVNFELCIDCLSGSGPGAVHFGSIVVSFGAGFTGGTTSLRPTATDEQILINQTTILPTASGNSRWHLMQSSDGACTRLFVTHSGAPLTCWIFDKVTNAVTGWTNPIIAHATISAATTDWSSATGTFSIRPASTNGLASLGCEGNAGGTVSAIAAGAVANELDSSNPILPLSVLGITGGMRGRNATVIDLWAGGAGVVTGDTYPNDTTYQFAQFGTLIVPWNATLPAI